MEVKFPTNKNVYKPVTANIMPHVTLGDRAKR